MLAPAKVISPGPLEAVGAAAVVAIFLAVAAPELGQILARARANEARGVLHEFAAAAKAHYLRTGSYRCGACGASPPDPARLALVWQPQAAPASDACIGDSLATGLPYQDAQGFLAAAVFPGRRSCEVWTIDHHGRLRHHTPPQRRDGPSR